MKVDILAFAAHPDDIEISCGATIRKHIDAGKKIAIVDFTRGELGTRGTAATRMKESAASSKVLGIHDRVNLGFRDGFFVHDEFHLLETVKMIRKYQPEIVLANTPKDRHPDHGRASGIVSNACFLSGLIKVKTSLNGKEQEKWRPKAVYHYIQDYYMQPDFVVDVTGYEQQKLEALKAFKTQFYDPTSDEPETPISGNDFFEVIIARMRELGRPIGAEFAEGFVADRFIGVQSFDDLI